ncbi:hypothetical protein I3760_11G093000 [Carya illinoinensis]|nr:hypothetical protein I3760_11G093000 [Carya illinoinensis]
MFDLFQERKFPSFFLPPLSSSARFFSSVRRIKGRNKLPSGHPFKLFQISSVQAVSMNPTPPPHDFGISSPITVILTVILLVFFFLGFFSVYFCRCFIDSMSTSRRSPSRNVGSGADASDISGLNPSLIASFPTFVYSSVKDFRKEKYGLECAICLVEFEDDSLLRLLTVCYHVFHQECIDLWLESHKTCPVCRGNLDLPPESSEKSPAIVDHNAMHDIHGSNESSDDAEHVRIDIREDDDNESSESGGSHEHASKTLQNDHEDKMVERFSRSHTTGHSIVKRREDKDRYKLRLPEHIKVRLIRGHNFAKSCTTFGEFSNHEEAGNGGFGEVCGCSGGNINNV